MAVEVVKNNEPEDLLQSENPLSDEQRQRLIDIIKLFPNSAIESLGGTSIFCHTIDVGTAEPVKYRFYCLPVCSGNRLNMEFIDGNGEEANSKMRLCLDARKVNEVTKMAAYPLLLIDGIFSRLDKTRFISTVH